MAGPVRYLSGRQNSVKIGIPDYRTEDTALVVLGRVGVGTTNATSDLYVKGGGEFTGVDGKVTDVSAADNGLTIEGVKKEKLKGEKYDVFIHTSNIVVTGLNTDDKWRINKLEGKNVRAARPETDKKEMLDAWLNSKFKK